jgi:hypothetical protein
MSPVGSREKRFWLVAAFASEEALPPADCRGPVRRMVSAGLKRLPAHRVNMVSRLSPTARDEETQVQELWRPGGLGSLLVMANLESDV